MINVESLGFRYPSAKRAALEDITFTVQAGETVALIGCDNSGKSTLLCLMAGLAPQLLKGERRGKLQIAGIDPCASPPEIRLRKVGIVFSDPSSQITGICPSVEEEIAWSLGNLGVNSEQMHLRVEAVIQRLHLEDIRGCAPWKLSSGQQQLVAAAAALALDPQVLLFDEPLDNLDAISRRALVSLALETAESGHTVIWAAPSLEHVAGFSRWIYLDQGRIVYDGPPHWLGGSSALPAPWTRLAQRALNRGLWSGPLPLREDEAAEGFRAYTTNHGHHNA